MWMWKRRVFFLSLRFCLVCVVGLWEDYSFFLVFFLILIGVGILLMENVSLGGINIFGAYDSKVIFFYDFLV